MAPTVVSPGAPFGVGLIGAGTVGGEVARQLLAQRDEFRRRTGADLALRRVAVRDGEKPRPGIDRSLLTTNASRVLDDPSIAIVVEVAGGEEPARSFLERAVRNGKHVVTANKVVMARHGPDLLELAGELGVEVAFEAAVGGGIPLVGTFKVDLVSNRLWRVTAIINGTTNYMLTGMAQDGLTFEEALAQARREGYAEADPSEDIEGYDAASKIAIMGSIAFGARVHPKDVYREGITGVRLVDFRYARDLGYTIKLVARTERSDRGIEIWVHPCLVPLGHPLAQVAGVQNAVFIDGDLVGEVALQGPGAGARPTASAVIADLLDLSRRVRSGAIDRHPFRFEEQPLLPMGEVATRAYLRCTLRDEPGVLAEVARVFGEEGVSISSAIQQDAAAGDGSAEFVVTTHRAPEAALQRTRRRAGSLPQVRGVSSFLRIL
ncbi:MAG: homoserine dehydrogenase [Candidatus Dormibacteraceae bacterium]